MSAAEGTSARVVRNTIVNGLGMFTSVVLALVVTPFIIDDIGTAAYGVWALAIGLSFLGGYAALADLGIEGGIARFVAEARSENDPEVANRVASAGIVAYVLIAAVVTPALAALAWPLTALFGVGGDLRDEAVLCFVLVASQLIFELPARAYMAVLQGAQRFTLFQGIELVRALTLNGTIVVALVADWGLVGLGASLPLSSLAVLVAAWVVAHRAVPTLRIRRRLVDRATMRRLMTFGGGIALSRLTATVFRQMDKVILGAALGPRPVGVYEIANRLQTAAFMVQATAVSALLPAAAYARRDVVVLRDMFLRGTEYTVAMVMPAVLAIAIFADDLIRTWVGERMLGAAGPARLFVGYLILTSLTVVGVAMITALGHLRFVNTVGLSAVALNLVVSIALVGPLEIEGVIIGTLVGQAVATPLLLWRMLREFDASLGDFARRAMLPNLPGVAAQAATAVPLVAVADAAGNLAEVGGVVLVSMGASLLAFFLLGLRAEDRRTLTGTMLRAVGLSARAPR